MAEPNKKMSVEQRNRIAYAILRFRLAKDGITLGGSGKRELGNEAAAAGVSLAQMQMFAIDLLPELIESTFNVTNVRISFDPAQG